MKKKHVNQKKIKRNNIKLLDPTVVLITTMISLILTVTILHVISNIL